MAIYDIPIVASADDGTVLDWSPTSVHKTYPLAGEIRLGRYPENVYWYHAHLFLRFLLSIPDNEDIVVAYFRMSRSYGTAGVLARIYACDEANSPQLDPVNTVAAGIDFLARPRTTAYADWNDVVPGSYASWVNGPSLVEILRELRASYSYTSGQAVQFAIMDNGTPEGSYQSFFSWDISSQAYAPILHIETAASGAPVIYSITPDSVEQGASISLSVAGINLDSVTVVNFYSDDQFTTIVPGIVTSVQVVNATEITLNIIANTTSGIHGIGVVTPVSEARFTIEVTPTSFTARKPANSPVNILESYGTAWRPLVSAADRAHYIAGMQARGLNVFSAQVDPTVYAKITQEPANVAAGIAAFNAAGIEVWASWHGGSAGWTGTINGQQMSTSMAAVVQYNKAHPTARFSGLEMDLEPPTGSSLEQHNTHLGIVYDSLVLLRAMVVDGTETVESQQLPITMWCDPRWGNVVCAENWAKVVSQCDCIAYDNYRWGDVEGDRKIDGIMISINNNSAARAIAVAQGRYIICGLNSGEDYQSVEQADPQRSRYWLGIAAYEQAMMDYAAYYLATYGDLFCGHTHYWDVGGWLDFMNIDAVTWPVGSIYAGDTLTVPYTTRRRADRYSAGYVALYRTFGVKLELTDALGSVWEVSGIIACLDGQSTNRTISMTIPPEVADGPATVRLTLWAIGWPVGAVVPGESASSTWVDVLYYLTYAGQTAALLAMDMTELAAAGAAGARTTPVVLQDSGQITGLTIGGGEGDTTPPVISVVASTPGETSATVTFSTNEPATTTIEYDTSGTYGLQYANFALVTSHSAVLSGLTPGMLYHYRIVTEDAAGNLSVSGDYTFTTAGTVPPESDIFVTGLSLPDNPVVGQNVVITVTVQNFGTAAGSRLIELTGAFIGAQTVQLAAGEQRLIYFVVVPPAAGTYSIIVGEASTTLNVLIAVESNKPASIGLALGVVAMLAIAMSKKGGTQ